MLVYFEYNITEITNTSETWYNKCCYSESNPTPVRSGPLILHEMPPHLFLPEENAAPFPPLAWIPLICNPVKKQRLSSDSVLSSWHTLQAWSHWQHTDFKCLNSVQCGTILHKTHYVHVDTKLNAFILQLQHYLLDSSITPHCTAQMDTGKTFKFARFPLRHHTKEMSMLCSHIWIYHYINYIWNVPQNIVIDRTVVFYILLTQVNEKIAMNINRNETIFSVTCVKLKVLWLESGLWESQYWLLGHLWKHPHIQGGMP
jgi:hypothetical protein